MSESSAADTCGSSKPTPNGAAEVVRRLMGCLVNARERPQHGFKDVPGLVQAAPAFAMTYSHLEEAGAQLEAVLGSVD